MEILNREIEKENDKIIITSTTRETYTRDRVLNEIYNLQMQKEHIIQQSKEYKKQYDELVEKENEMKEWLEENPEEFQSVEGD